METIITENPKSAMNNLKLTMFVQSRQEQQEKLSAVEAPSVNKKEEERCQHINPAAPTSIIPLPEQGKNRPPSPGSIEFGIPLVLSLT